MQNALWDLILALKEKVKSTLNEEIQYCHLCLSGRIAINQELSTSSSIRFFIKLSDHCNFDTPTGDAVIQLNGISMDGIGFRISLQPS